MLRASLIARGSLLLTLAAVGAVQAQAPPPKTYDYGGGSGAGGYTGDAGFLVFVEGGIVNPRNTDNVVATRIGSVVSPVIPTWDDDFAGRVGLGYQWASGNRLYGQIWGYSTETSAAGTGNVAFAIGPPIAPGFGAEGTGFSIGTEIEATTADLILARQVPLSEGFGIQWSVGMRYAYFEEISEGSYRDGATIFAADKSNEGEMLGVRGGLRGSWQWGRFVLEAGGALSLLDGELTGSSGLDVVQGGSGSSAFAVVDDGRSGSIQEIDLIVGWRSESGSWLITGGWEQQVWEGITTDMVRHYPGASVPLQDRDSIAFSGYKAGVTLVF